MHVTMVKKVLANGEPCAKCGQAEELLKGRGLWGRIDEVVIADEADPESPGMRLAAKHDVKLAPFFIVRDDAGRETVHTSTLRFVKDVFGGGDAPAPPPSSLAVTADEIGEVARRLSSEDPRAIVRWALERFGASCAIAFSGAEDVVLIDMAAQTGLPFSVFSLETGRLHPETYQFIDRVRSHYGIEIAFMAPETAALQAFVRKKGLFSFYEDGHAECCGIRKVEPLGRALAGYRAWMTGQRRDQSPTRADVAHLQIDGARRGSDGAPLVKLNPLATWTLDQTWGYLRENRVPYNPLHDRGFISIGCEPCTRPPRPGEHERAGRWWWEEATQRECGLHISKVPK